jgi:hypothetical protein
MSQLKFTYRDIKAEWMTWEQSDWFDNLWENEADVYEFYELAEDIEPTVNKNEFLRNWQWYTPNSVDDIGVAFDEFRHLLFLSSGEGRRYMSYRERDY